MVFEQRLMAVVKAVIALLLVGVVVYTVVAGVAIPELVMQLVLLVLGVYFGFSAKLYRDNAKRL